MIINKKQKVPLQSHNVGVCIDIKRMSNEELLEEYKKYDKLTDKPHGLAEQLMFEEIKREFAKREE